MKYARKMVLVDVDTIRPSSDCKNVEEDSKVVKALNTLVTQQKFNKNNFGDYATNVELLDREMREILDSTLEPLSKLKLYNQKLQKYLFLVRDNEENPQRPSTNLPHVYVPSEVDISMNVSPEPDISTPSSTKPEISRVFTETPVSHHQHTSNLPRLTPIQERLRAIGERQKNSRYKDYFVNWTEGENE